jgi:hypothetical protein
LQLEAERAKREKWSSTLEELQKSKEDAKVERLKYVEDMQVMWRKQDAMQKQTKTKN